ncbi:BCS1 N terminal-domain-containing protein [Podospora conica]|nr:BCS1 N terminal-domain-containing protein [Schizothecium conicum]
MDRLMETIVAMTPGAGPSATDAIPGTDDPIISPAPAPQMMLLDFFFPGFSIFSAAVQKTLHVDLNLYIPLVLLAGGLTFVWQYFSEYAWKQIEAYLMSVVDIRTDDEIYNMLMTWVASQRFAQGARRFVVNTNLSSRSWFLYKWDEEEDEEDGEEDSSGRQKKKALAYTPTFGSHWFWFKGRLLIFRRSQGTPQAYGFSTSEKEEISISCFGRNPWVLKELLHEARTSYMKRDEAKTLIYRGTTRSGSTEPTWQRCMSRASRPFSTVILNEKVKKDLIDDVTDYLDPNTRRWYSNRGIPYRRGYLLYGPPGTGKSSLSLALAGFFKMRIYIVSLSSVTANEENLASLFAELPRRCVVLLEDIDTAGLTHTRDNNGNPTTTPDSPTAATDMVPGQLTPGVPAGAGKQETSGRLSLSGLLNILDGVASQEGRVLIMTTNHIEKLDKALIRPGRVDMTVKFDKADAGMTAAIFRAIFAPLEGDDAPPAAGKFADLAEALEAERKAAAERAREREVTLKRVEVLAGEFAAKVPAHEFSPAELQGYLMKNKKNPEAAVEGAAEWVVATRKDKKEKELKESEDKRKEEEEEKKAAEKKKKEEEEEKKKAEEEERKKKEEEKKKEDEERKKSRKKSRKSKSKKSSSRRKGRKDESDESGSSDSESSSESEAEASGAEGKKSRKAKAAVEEKKEATPMAVDKPAVVPVVVVAPPATLKTEESNKTVVGLETEGVDKVAQPVVSADDGKVQQGADSGYGTP